MSIDPNDYPRPRYHGYPYCLEHEVEAGDDYGDDCEPTVEERLAQIDSGLASSLRRYDAIEAEGGYPAGRVVVLKGRAGERAAKARAELAA